MINTWKYRIVDWGPGMVFSIFLYVHVTTHIPGQLCELEHNNLFVADATTYRLLWSEIGGTADVAGRWLTQFFALPGLGAVAFLLPVVLLWPVMAALLRRASASAALTVPAAFGTALAQLLAQYDFNYYVSGSLATLGALLTLLGVALLRHPRWRDIAFLVGIPCVAGLCGPAVTVYVACGLLLFATPSRGLRSCLLPLLVFALILCAGYATGSIDHIGSFLSPVNYYCPQLEMPAVAWLPWVYPILLCGAVRLLSDTGITWRPLLRGGIALAVWAALAGGFAHYEKTYRNTSNQLFWQLNHYAFTHDWDGLLNCLSARQPITNLLYMNYANMALAQTNRLGDYAFHFYPKGIKSLLVDPNSTSAVHMLLSDVHYTVGCIAEAQRNAFEAQTALPHMLGVQPLMRLIETNLIQGHEAVAAKYIDLLEKTLFYKEQARRYRSFLGNPQAVAADPELGGKLRALSRTNRFAMNDGWERELEDILEADPTNTKAATYLGLCYLLNKDMNGFCRFLDTYYGTECLKTLPLAFQQGVTVAYPQQSGQWEHYQVSPSVRELYVRYTKQWAGIQQMPGRKRQMKKDFGQTFWYFYMFS